MYICEHCGTPFDIPRVVKTVFWDDGRRVIDKEAICPVCCWPEFFPADICPGCREYKDRRDILCTACRRSLSARFRRFADGLTAEEEAQLDDWLDGTSITERRNFS